MYQDFGTSQRWLNDPVGPDNEHVVLAEANSPSVMKMVRNRIAT